jgi:hypothetical protein
MQDPAIGPATGRAVVSPRNDRFWDTPDGPPGVEPGRLPHVVSVAAERALLWRGRTIQCGSIPLTAGGLSMTLAPRSHASPGAGTRPWATSQASSTVSARRTLRPRCTTGSCPVHRSRAHVSELTPNQRRASGRGMSCGGAGSSSGSSCCRTDGRLRGRTRLDKAAMAGIPSLCSQAVDVVDGSADLQGLRLPT